VWKVYKVYKTSILEDDEDEIPVKDGSFSVHLGPFQVGTYRLCLAEADL
jgi:alpha-mannosidase